MDGKNHRSWASLTDQGIIAGYGKKNGQPRVWMLRPQL